MVEKEALKRGDKRMKVESARSVGRFSAVAVE
jgi:hypothetical protein